MVYIALVAAAALVGIDQLLKYVAIEKLQPIYTYPIFENVLHLTYAENRGAAFSMLSGKTWILVGLTGLILLAAVVLLLSKKIKSTMMIWAIALVIGGGLGNLVDRIFRGFVVDYIDFRVINFAIFNFADICVCVGVGLLFLYILIIEPLRERKKNKLVETISGDDGE